MAEITIIRTNSDNPDFRTLIRQLDEHLWGRYGEEQGEYDGHNKIENNNRVVIAYIDRKPIGCGCFKQFDEKSIEIKRMFVDPDERGKGGASLILSELERWGKETGYNRAVLETGNKQTEAIALYKKMGYVVTANYPPYVEMSSSICMKKSLK